MTLDLKIKIDGKRHTIESGIDSVKQVKDAVAVVKARSTYLADVVALPLDGDAIQQVKGWLVDISQQLTDMITKQYRDTGNQFDVDRSFLKSHRVSDVDEKGALAMTNILDCIKNISFQRNVVQYTTRIRKRLW